MLPLLPDFTHCAVLQYVADTAWVAVGGSMRLEKRYLACCQCVKDPLSASLFSSCKPLEFIYKAYESIRKAYGFVRKPYGL